MYVRVWGGIVSGSVVSLEFVHMGFYTPCLFSSHMPSQTFSGAVQLVSSQFGSGECVWLSVGLCSNGAATRARFWGRIRIWKMHSWWRALNVKLGCGFTSPLLPGKQTKGSGVSATHCTQRGPPFWKLFLLPAILRPRFWGRFLAPFLGPRKSKQELLTALISSICWRQLSFCNASRYYYNIRRQLQPHTGVHENIYFAVCIVIFVPFDCVVFFGPVFCPCHFFVIFLSLFCHFFVILCFGPVICPCHFLSCQRRALFRHLNFQKWSGAGVLCAFWLRNVLRATTACNFSSLIWPAGSAPAALASLLFDPPEPQIIGKTLCFATFLPFRASASSFFWLFLFYSSLF